MPALRSRTGDHTLLPSDVTHVFVPQDPLKSVSLSSWSFGKGTVIWKIWPAVVFHTLFAALVVSISEKVLFLGIPSVMLTVLGVVIGFVLAYRVSSGYDRYWFGRCYWSDIVRNTRTMARLIWFHVPLKMTPNAVSSTTDQSAMTANKEIEESIMREKRMALDLLEGFSVAVKHHLRGETGIYYEDLYHLVRPLHEEKDHHHHHNDAAPPHSTAAAPQLPYSQSQPKVERRKIDSPPNGPATLAPDQPTISEAGYGTFTGDHADETQSLLRHRQSHSSLVSCGSSGPPELLPANASAQHRSKLSRDIATDLVPFTSVVANIIAFFSAKKEAYNPNAKPRLGSQKHRPAIAALNNIPLTILQSLSEYFAVLEGRNVVPGTSLGTMIATIQMFEDSLSGLERVLTTPLPFIYSVHIRHAIWLYLFFLPFQLVRDFGWHTIPGVGIAAFFYLGFLAAGEEIEQPFGYDENDLDLDSFIRHIIHVDLTALKGTSCPNVRLPEGAKKKKTLIETAKHESAKDRERVALEGVFGEYD